MKQCPGCNEVFDDQKAFCDMDGSELVKLTDSPQANVEKKAPSGAESVWVTGVIGGFIGVVVCVMLYLAFLAPSRETAQQENQNNQNTETAVPKSNQIAVVPAGPTPMTSASETASPAEPEASPTESPVAPAQTTPPAALNHGPIATGGKAVANGERAIIKMKDGTSLEADAAWEDAQGIWYRRSGVVSFLDKSKVESITEPPQKRPAESETKKP